MPSKKAKKTTKKAAGRGVGKAKKPATRKAPRGASKKGRRMSTVPTRRMSATHIASLADSLLTLTEAAERIGSSASYLRWLCNFRHDSHVPFAAKMGRNWMIPESRLADIPLENKGITGRPPGSGAGPKKAGAKKAGSAKGGGAKKAGAKKAGAKKAGAKKAARR
jgi:hypothetical protein